MISEVLIERIRIRVAFEATTADHPDVNWWTATASHVPSGTVAVERTSTGAIALGTGTAALAAVTS